MENLLISLTYLELCPFLLNVGRALEQTNMARVHYIAFTPLESAFARRNLPKGSYTLASQHKASAQAPALDETARQYASEFVFKKHGGPVRHWSRRVQRLFEVLHTVVDREQISLLLLWNGQDMPGRLAQWLAQQHGLACYFLENGYFSNTLQADSAGVNAAASICKLPLTAVLQQAEGSPSTVAVSLPPIQLPSIRPPSTLNRRLFGLRKRLDPFFYRTYPELRYPAPSRGKPASSASLASVAQVTNRRRPFALIVLQVHDDTQLLLNTDLFTCPKAFIRHCVESIQAVWGSNLDMVVKLHPADLGRIDYSDVMREFPQLLWIGRDPVEPLLQACHVVMVVNSSVGLQAIAAHRPTLVFGRSLYTRPELCFCIQHPSDTTQALAQIQQGNIPFEPALQSRFVQYLQQHFFVEGSWRNTSPDGLAPLLKRLHSVLVNPTHA